MKAPASERNSPPSTYDKAKRGGNKGPNPRLKMDFTRIAGDIDKMIDVGKAGFERKLQNFMTSAFDPSYQLFHILQAVKDSTPRLDSVYVGGDVQLACMTSDPTRA